MAKTRTVTFSYNPHYKRTHDASTTTTAAAKPLKHLDLAQYTEVSAEGDSRWFSGCVELATVLMDLRSTYKQLEQRKRQLKKAQSSKDASKSSPLSTQMKDEENSQTSETPETSANDHESESDQGRPHKRRRTAL